tara:strand:+ start:417 stop:686 length:270 start_codon:yes stop_codon:yes gene_type:complete
MTDSPIGEDRARIIAAEEADKRTGKHEDGCAEQYRQLKETIHEGFDTVWNAIDTMRGRAWKIALWLIGGQFSLLVALVAYIWVATVLAK